MIRNSLLAQGLAATLTRLAVLLALPARAAALEETYSETFPLAASGRLSLENINGDVEIEGWDRDEIQIDYVKRGRDREALERVKVEIDATADRVSIETDWESSRGWNDHAEVDFTIWLPRTTRLDEIELVNGSLGVRGVAGDLHASLVNGDLKATELSGDVELETVNGSLEVSLARLEANQTVRLDSVNGSVDLILPGNIDADVSAETVHGRIKNDFDLEVERGRYVGSSMRGVLGRGGARIELENVNGSISLHAG